MGLLGNVIWLIFGGALVAIEYATMGLAYCVTIIGIPWGIQCFKLAILSLWPFNTRVQSFSGGAAVGCINFIFNLIWIFTGGIIIWLTHMFFGILLCITIVGFPWGAQHFKLARLSFFPFGKTVF